MNCGNLQVLVSNLDVIFCLQVTPTKGIDNNKVVLDRSGISNDQSNDNNCTSDEKGNKLDLYVIIVIKHVYVLIISICAGNHSRLNLF